MEIKDITLGAGKTYVFNDNHDPNKPAQFWFQNSHEGLILFLVLYTQACRWSRCLGCNLPSKVSQYHVPFSSIMAQVDHLFDTVISDEQKRELKKIILSNNGSILDEETFSTTALIYFIAKMNLNCPNIASLCIETRPEYIDWEELEVLSRALKEGETPTDLEIAIGFEAFDERIRNEYFHKGMALDVFEKMVEKLAKYHYKLKTYFMMKPVPGISEREGIEDIVNAVDYLDRISGEYGIEINMHLNPTYVASGTELERSFNRGDYSPPRLTSVCEALSRGEGKRIRIFIGLNDEGLAVEGGSFIRDGESERVKKLEEFNRTQDYRLLSL